MDEKEKVQRQLNQPTFTVFTPTFNRAHLLYRVFESLRAQTYANFEWLIVDDGSTDGTKEIVDMWRGKVNFHIRYFWQENQGKHIAFNKATREAHGELFLPLDSDDACIPEALERFKYHWDLIPENQKDQFTGVCALCKDQYGKLVGDPFPFDPTDSNSLEIYYRYKIKGEKWGFHRVNVLHRFPFPEVQEIKFIPEGFIWNAIAKSYKIRYVNEVLRVYWRPVNPDSDQLTNMIHRGYRHALGCKMYYQSCLNENIDWFHFTPREFFRTSIHYIRYSLHAKVSILKAIKGIYPIFSKLLVGLALPIGFIVYVSERMGWDAIGRFNKTFKSIRHSNQ